MCDLAAFVVGIHMSRALSVDFYSLRCRRCVAFA